MAVVVVVVVVALKGEDARTRACSCFIAVALRVEPKKSRSCKERCSGAEVAVVARVWWSRMADRRAESSAERALVGVDVVDLVDVVEKADLEWSSVVEGRSLWV